MNSVNVTALIFRGFEVAAFYLRPARQFLVGTCIGESCAREKNRRRMNDTRGDSGEKKDGEIDREILSLSLSLSLLQRSSRVYERIPPCRRVSRK